MRRKHEVRRDKSIQRLKALCRCCSHIFGCSESDTSILADKYSQFFMAVCRLRLSLEGKWLLTEWLRSDLRMKPNIKYIPASRYTIIPSLGPLRQRHQIKPSFEGKKPLRCHILREILRHRCRPIRLIPHLLHSSRVRPEAVRVLVPQLLVSTQNA